MIKEQVKEKMINCKKRFAIAYHNSAFFTDSNKQDVVSAIKEFNSHYNSTITLIYDTVEGSFYYSKENDNPNIRGYFSHSYYNLKTKELIYNEDENIAPLIPLIPTSPNAETQNGYIDRDGNFYECDFEEHSYLAKELIITKTIIIEEHEKDWDPVRAKDWEKYLDEKGWVKISSNRITCALSLVKMRNMLSLGQRSTIEEYLKITKANSFEYQWMPCSKERILVKIYEKD